METTSIIEKTRIIPELVCAKIAFAETFKDEFLYEGKVLVNGRKVRLTAKKELHHVKRKASIDAKRLKRKLVSEMHEFYLEDSTGELYAYLFIDHERFDRMSAVQTGICKDKKCLISGKALYVALLNYIQHLSDQNKLPYYHEESQDKHFGFADSRELTPEQWKEIFEPMLEAKYYECNSGVWTKIYKPNELSE